MDKKNRLLLLFSVITLAIFGTIIVQRESLRAEDRTVLLQLAPRDPRSIMQGDYMVLRYSITRNRPDDRKQKKGFVVCREKDGVAERIRTQKKRTPLADDEFVIQYRMVQFDMSIGPDEFFFQEREGGKYARARFAKVAVSDEGQISILGLYNNSKEEIK